MKLRTRIGLMFATGLAVVALATIGSWLGANVLLDTTREVRAIHERLEVFDDLLGDLVDVETGARGFVITGQESYLDPYDRAAARLPENVRRLTRLLVGDPAPFVRDISERKRAQAEIQAAVAAREELLAVVSHDLKNPLNAILLREDLLERKRGADRDLTDHARWVRRSVENMQRMIRDLLDAANLDAGHLVLDVAANDIGAIIDEVVDALGPIATEANIAIERQLPEHRVARCDRERLAQVIYNLVGNAVRFTPAGGRIAIRAEATPDELHITVADTGRGITPEVLPRIFDRYFTTEHGRRGTGLGLHIARGVVEAHGGRIWAISVPGQGATFHVAIPGPEPMPLSPP